MNKPTVKVFIVGMPVFSMTVEEMILRLMMNGGAPCMDLSNAHYEVKTLRETSAHRFELSDDEEG